MKFELAETLLSSDKGSDVELIKSRIQTFGLKQKHIASKLQVSEDHLSRILLGKKPLTDEMRAKLFTYLAITV